MWKQKLNLKSLTAIGLSLSILFSFSSCEKDPEGDPPELPPVESLVMDFSDFDEQPGGKKATEATYENFLHSYLSVAFWNIASTVTLALPVTAYGYALQQEAVYMGDNTWEWAYDFTLQDVSYTAKLTGARIDNEKFSMEMVISLSSVPNQGVKWFDGVVRYDHTQATWKLYREGSVQILEAVWNKDFETGDADLKYTYVEEGKEETGSYIMYSRTPENFFDASYSVSLAAGETLIEWNTETIEGRVQDLNRFEDSDWHCWDSLENGLVDKVCE